jgi:hypothetical protein
MNEAVIEDMRRAAEQHKEELIDGKVLAQCVMTPDTTPERGLDYVFGKAIARGLLTVVGAPGACRSRHSWRV